MLNAIKNKVTALNSEIDYKFALWKHTKNLPAIAERDRVIVDALKREGVYVTTLADLGLDSTTNLLNAARNQLSTMAAVQNSQIAQRLPQIYTVTDLPEFFTWGSEQKLLNIVENYIGLPVAFQGVHLRKDFPNENQFGTLLWHKDSEDRRMVKIIIYLTDVEEKHGPFEYVPLSLTPLHSLNYYRIYYKLWQSGYLGINDEQLQEIIPKSAWKSCPGPAGTVIFADPKTALHHGTLRTEERSALFFVYTANPPKRPELCTQYWDDTFPKPELCQTSEVM
ncbi:phytanoyl-CoA dioxygenase family protein [Fischerella thermalis]|uniref:phytanoyl-CoA dioxygenase family protein n=1 Tax=Fischerella thermalis TaxID=372787 RepID=UPI000C805E00|nr:phytanoyl-CoA dioxygenase family protein [Fischerella thermalis]PLZ14467.1 phytanoyl-CoA dioxygenase [Fischerella thermalis WC1110]PLZ29048.1 phytanoyl-CoA dioxygenase [Fischerella thermalis WC341]PLZ32005.1 phytanoyl-CoA dioxygenase [Fischerella thermalis WC559]PLZ32650.1 phytanoyl-CoA dioxygenase [Fischerella thermalis WC558]PLZ36184.1 phytanoyl-CoA dioxygenase [Fischerella thermalis WC538]